jgi:hypothetical protein
VYTNIGGNDRNQEKVKNELVVDFILLINGRGWSINWDLNMFMFSLINDGFYFLWPR